MIRRRRERLIAACVIGGVALMVGASYAAVPLYKAFCQATGYAGTTQVARMAPANRGTHVLTVRFDANVAPGLDWSFKPEVDHVELRTGETSTVFFKVTNRADRETVAQAIYNVAPDAAGAYFNKIACFCFNEQRLAAHETIDMPVVFFLDPALEKDETMAQVSSVTLSYTFYKAKAPLAAAASAPRL